MEIPKRQFCHEHVHDIYSVLDGISKPEDLIAKCKRTGMTALARTNHGNLYQSISFYKNCIEAGIKPIIGQEFYVSPDSMLNRTYAKKAEAEEDAKNGDLSYSAYHLTVLSKNRVGYENIKKLSTIAYQLGHYRKPRIDDEVLAAHKEGLIVFSGCLAGKIARLIIGGAKDKALEEIDKLRGLFGEDFYLELMDHKVPEEKIVIEALKDFGKLRGIPLVMTGDTHFTEHGDEFAHEVALAIGTNKNINDQNRFKFNGSGYWFKSPDEMYEAAAIADIPEEALTNTMWIASKVEDYGFKLTSKTKKSIIPLFRLDENTVLTDEQCVMMLEMKARQGLAERKLAHLPEYQTRLKEELDLIARKQFSSYFLIIADIIDFMRKKGRIIPIGRGSSLGALTCYSLFITGLDPIRLNLSFSRFMNEGRKDLPDIDTDISQRYRGEVIEYIVNKYGKDRVAHIITFQSMASKAASDNVGRGLGIPSQVRASVGKLIGDVDKEDKLADIIEDNIKVREKMSEHPKWIEIAQKLEGNIKNTSAHAAGIVISNDPIVNHVPLVRCTDEGYLVTQFDMKDLGELGLLKLDMLGLKGLDTIQDTIDLVKKRYNITLDFHDFPIWDGQDPATYATIAGGKYVSCFQYDSHGIRGAARAMAPTKFDHLVALNALYRPGPMKKVGNQPSIMEQYIERRHGRQACETWHPELDSVFKETYGLPLYQESVMAMARTMAGFNEIEADEYRAAIGKKDKIKFAAAQAKFKERGIKLGRTPKLMDDIIEKLAGFARYGWNKSHAAAYSYLSFVTAHLETHYPMEYYTSLLNVNADKNDDLKILLAAIIQRGIKIYPPHINKSGKQFETDGVNIYMGLYSVRQVGDKAVDPILSDLNTNGPFLDYADFCVRMEKHGKTVNKIVKENLVKAGAFSWDTSFNQKTLVTNTELIQLIVKKFANKLSPEEIKAQIRTNIAPCDVDYTEQEKLGLEQAVLNFYISSHPVLQYQGLFSLFQHVNLITPSQLNDQDVGSRVIMLGVIEDKAIKTTKNGNPYLSMTLGDNIGQIKQMIWSPLAEQCNQATTTHQLILLHGKVKEDRFRAGDNQLDVKGMMPITATHGLPITSFYAKDVPTANRILATLDATAADISDRLMNQGHMVTIKGTAYIRPEMASKLRECGQAYFTLSI
jgi:DNA polymerase III subunit alpha